MVSDLKEKLLPSRFGRTQKLAERLERTVSLQSPQLVSECAMMQRGVKHESRVEATGNKESARRASALILVLSRSCRDDLDLARERVQLTWK